MRSKNPRTRIGLLVVTLALVLVAAPAARADFDAAMDYFKSGKWLEAAGEFQALVDESPEYADGYFMLGVCFMKTAKPADAENNFLKAIALNGDKFVYHFNLANAYQVRGKYDRVVDALTSAEGLAQDSHKLKLYKLRGFANAAQKNWNETVDDLEKAKKIKADPSTLTQLGKAYFALGQNDRAVANFRETLKLEPDNAEAMALMVEALLNMGAKATSDSQKKQYYGDALTQAEALQAKQPNVKSRYLVGRAALGSGNYQRAADALTQVLQQKPNHCNAMANQGKAFIALKQFDNALAALENATTCAPRMALAWENKGFVLQKQKNYPEAIRAYEKASQIKPSSSIDGAIDTCKKNIEIYAENTEQERLEQAQEAAKLAEEKRVAAEQAKIEEWKRKQEEDD